jgi:ubiquinone/menaquinone biosynthesis C-methylase UbiE
MIEAASVAAPRAEDLLEQILQCPACRARRVRVQPRVLCAACGWLGRSIGGIPDFVDRTDARQDAETVAQQTAVTAYYENEEKLSCHWDRMTAQDLPDFLGGPAALVLDLGCGTGSAGGAFRRRGAKVVGADLVPECLEVARRRLDGVVRVDATALPFADEVFDAVVSRGALHHFADPLAALQEARRVMRPGAEALFLDPREFGWLEPLKRVIRRQDDSFTDDHHAFPAGAYRELIGSVFEVVETRTFYPLAILATVGLDLVPLPKALPKRLTARALLRVDELLNATPARHLGHLLMVRARRT